LGCSATDRPKQLSSNRFDCQWSASFANVDRALPAFLEDPKGIASGKRRGGPISKVAPEQAQRRWQWRNTRSDNDMAALVDTERGVDNVDIDVGSVAVSDSEAELCRPEVDSERIPEVVTRTLRRNCCDREQWGRSQWWEWQPSQWGEWRCPRAALRDSAVKPDSVVDDLDLHVDNCAIRARPNRVAEGSINWDGEEITGLENVELAPRR
jgi:hypothetical protein